MILAKLAVWGLGTAVVGGAILCSEGMITVRVHQEGTDKHNIFVVAPAMLVPMAVHFMPRGRLQEFEREIRPELPLIRVATDALADCPDAVFLEVSERDQHVRVAKRWGAIVVDVNQPGEVVHVSVPIGAMRSAVRALAESGPTS